MVQEEKSRILSDIVILKMIFDFLVRYFHHNRLSDIKWVNLFFTKGWFALNALNQKREIMLSNKFDFVEKIMFAIQNIHVLMWI